jgi:uncharacterized membrane protein YedE/YeeE
MKIALQFMAGLVFGLGLVIAGMSNPAKVLNFLDVAAIARGGWDASLAFVMAGAIAVTFIGYRLAWGREAPLFDTRFHLPTRADIDAQLVAGAAIFGLGWGLTGVCPGPAFTLLAAPTVNVLLFVAAMFAGLYLARAIQLVQRA